MREGARIVINEVSHASPDCLSLFYAVCESPETAQITLPTGEDLRPSPGFQVVFTDNIDPVTLPGPLLDRCDATFMVIGPSPDAIQSFPEDLREAVLGSALAAGSKRISLRSWETINRLVEGGMNAEDAGVIVLGSRWHGVRDSVQLSKLFKK
jgi:hypothetical protein